MPRSKRADTQLLERMPRADLIRRIVELESQVIELRDEARRERAYADRMHDRAVRAVCPNGTRISDADPL